MFEILRVTEPGDQRQPPPRDGEEYVERYAHVLGNAGVGQRSGCRSTRRLHQFSVRIQEAQAYRGGGPKYAVQSL